VSRLERGAEKKGRDGRVERRAAIVQSSGRGVTETHVVVFTGNRGSQKVSMATARR
jgi:hypothetical protein